MSDDYTRKSKRRELKNPVPTVDRFWAKVRKADGCWEWTAGGLKHKGYGQFAVSHRKLTPAHRFSWELHNGPIPIGLYVSHHCDNRKCVRPDHLFLGTCADNLADMTAKGRRVSRAYWTDGRCGRGHDVTDPLNVCLVREPGGRTRRRCVACRREIANKYARKVRGA